MPRYKVTEYTDANPSIERVIEGPAETLEAYAALIREHATTSTLADTLIASAAKSLPQLPIGAGITGMPDSVHCITIHRLIAVPRIPK